MDPIDQDLWNAVCDQSPDGPRQAILHIEKQLVTFMQDKPKKQLQLPPASPYLRRLTHILCDRFGLKHQSIGHGQRAINILKTPHCRIPTPLLSTFGPDSQQPDCVKAAAPEEKKHQGASQANASRGRPQKQTQTQPSRKEVKPNEVAMEREKAKAEADIDDAPDNWEDNDDPTPQMASTPIVPTSIASPAPPTRTDIPLRKPEDDYRPQNTNVVRRGRGFNQARPRTFGSEDYPVETPLEEATPEAAQANYNTEPTPSQKSSKTDNILELFGFSDDATIEDVHEWLGSHLTGDVKLINPPGKGYLTNVLVVFPDSAKAMVAYDYLLSIGSGMFSVNREPQLVKPTRIYDPITAAESEVQGLKRPQLSGTTARRFILSELAEKGFSMKKTEEEATLEEIRREKKAEREKNKSDLESVWGEESQDA